MKGLIDLVQHWYLLVVLRVMNMRLWFAFVESLRLHICVHDGHLNVHQNHIAKGKPAV